MKRTLLLSAAALALGACRPEYVRYKSYPPNPFPDLTVVAVLPFFNETSTENLDTIDFANIFASELVKFDGFRVVRPRMILASLGEGEVLRRNVDDVLRVARRHRADAVVVASVTDYDPYVPPRIGISVQFLRTSARALTGSEIDRIVQSASWRRGPLNLSRDRAGNLLAAFELVLDSHEERIRSELIAYWHAQDERDSPFTDEGSFLAIQSRYQQFVSNQVINDIIWFTTLAE